MVHVGNRSCEGVSVGGRIPMGHLMAVNHFLIIHHLSHGVGVGWLVVDEDN